MVSLKGARYYMLLWTWIFKIFKVKFKYLPGLNNRAIFLLKYTAGKKAL
jgi:hypothetical protein